MDGDSVPIRRDIILMVKAALVDASCIVPNHTQENEEIMIALDMLNGEIERNHISAENPQKLRKRPKSH